MLLLDMPRLPHPALRCRAGGDVASAPPSLARYILWASEKLAALGAGAPARWRYECGVCLEEAYLHITGSKRGVCAHLGRPHTHQQIMVTLDLCNGFAWQRCWDQRCVHKLA